MAEPQFNTANKRSSQGVRPSKAERSPRRGASPQPSEIRVSLGVALGTDAETGQAVVQLNEDRFRHTVVLGRTGAGKSNLVKQMERQDILDGAGCFILAASEDDALYPLQCVPRDRMNDVVLIDASNPHCLPCLNPLDVDRSNPAAVDKAVSDALELLKTDTRHDFAGPRFDQMARIGLQLMLHPLFPDDPSLSLLERLFTDPEYVKRGLEACRDDYLHTQWVVEGNAHKSSDHNETVQWFLSKVNRITANTALSAMFGPGRRTIDVKRIVDEGKILIAAIPAARIGSDAARMVSSWLVMQLRDAILQRSVEHSVDPFDDLGFFGADQDSGRYLDPFFVYIDEFAQFANDDFIALLAQARKHRVGFTLSFQTLSQMRTYNMRTGKTSSDLHDAILGNVGSAVAFSVGSVDATALARHFDVDERDVRSIGRYAPLASLCMDGMTCAPRTLNVDKAPEPIDPSIARCIAKSQIERGIWLPVQ